MAPFVLADWSEMDGYPRETLNLENMKAVTKFKGPWNQRWEFLRLLYDAPFFLLQQIKDDPKSSFPLGDLRPRSATAVPLDKGPTPFVGGTTITWARYKFAVVTINFSSPEFGAPVADPQNPDLFISETIEPSLQLIGMSPDNFQWASDGADVDEDEAPDKIVNTLDYSLTRHEIDVVDERAYDFVGHLNNKILVTKTESLGGKKFEVGTVLYHGITTQRTTSLITGEVKQTVRMMFRIKRMFNPGDKEKKVFGWNSFWRGDIGMWDTLVLKTDVGGTPVDYSGFPFAALHEL